MKRNVKDILSYKVDGSDGVIGKVADLCFDDETWIVRYLVLKTGSWFAGRKVLISPNALTKEIRENGALPTGLSKGQIRNGPVIDPDTPFSWRQEVELHNYYRWNMSGSTEKVDWGFALDPHLRSTRRIIGNAIHATDAQVGHVTDFIVDDKTWELPYLAITSNSRLGGRRMVLAVHHVKQLQWNKTNVLVNLTVASMRDAREFVESEIHQPEPASGHRRHAGLLHK
jgi:PRC-barrel domain protein